MSDNGAAALAERLAEREPHLHNEYDPPRKEGVAEWSGTVRTVACTSDLHLPEAAAILGERGVFLPDGLDGHPDAGVQDRNHYDWFMPPRSWPPASDARWLDEFEAKLRSALTDPFVHDMAHSVLPLIAEVRRLDGLIAKVEAILQGER